MSNIFWKFKNLLNVKTELIPAVIGAVGIITYELEDYLINLQENHITEKRK